jgi:hypothetical protein
MPDFVPEGYLHICDAVVRWAEVIGIPAPRTTPPRSWPGHLRMWRPPEISKRARDSLRQELYAGQVRAFEFLIAHDTHPPMS